MAATTIEPKIKYPQARSSIINSFADLANYDKQMREWVDSKYKHAFSDSIWFYGLDYLIEDQFLNFESYNNIGKFFYDTAEAEIVQNFCIWAFDLVDNQIGMDEPDAAYYTHPEWQTLVKRAFDVQVLMRQNNLKYEFWRDFTADCGDEYKSSFNVEDEDFLSKHNATEFIINNKANSEL